MWIGAYYMMIITPLIVSARVGRDGEVEESTDTHLLVVIDHKEVLKCKQEARKTCALVRTGQSRANQNRACLAFK